MVRSPHLKLEEGSVVNRIFGKKEKAPVSSVLFVDDDAALTVFISKLLQDEAYNVHTANSGNEALQLLDHIALPDVFIVDFTLPDMNGQQFVEQLRLRFGRTDLPPVLLLTAALEGEAAANHLQVEDYLPKPFDNDDLLEHIGNLLKKPQKD
jgi:CheY-like chemotaxis protein